MTTKNIDHLDSVVQSPALPFCSGTIRLPASSSFLYYGPVNDARRIDFHTPGDHTQALDELERSCEPATFGLNKEDVLDETYRKAGKMDVDRFKLGFDVHTTGLIDTISTSLLPREEKRPIVAELYKLNVYGKGSFFKAHKDTPRAENMFGSLVVVLPAPHEGGALVFRHQHQEWTFDSAKIFANLGDEASSHIAFAAFYSDIEHEVLPVTAGHRLTVTWNLYHGESAELPALRVLEPSCASDSRIEDALSAVLGDATFLPGGGLLGFALRHEYAVSTERRSPLADLEPWLKGADGALFDACARLGLEPALRAVLLDDGLGVYTMFARRPELWRIRLDIGDNGSGVLRELVETENAVPLMRPWACLRDTCRPDGAPLHPSKALRDAVHRSRGPSKGVAAWDEAVVRWSTCGSPDGEGAQTVYWVTKPAEANVMQESFVALGNQAEMGIAYMEVCLIAKILPATERAGNGSASDSAGTG